MFDVKSAGISWKKAKCTMSVLHAVCLQRCSSLMKKKCPAKRKRILDLHLHPIIVHMPQAFGFFQFIGFIVLIFLTGSTKNDFYLTLKIISCCLFVSIVGAFFAGLIDGKIRFKKITTPILRQKIFYGILFFILSAVMMLNLFLFNVESLYSSIALIAESFVAFICSFILGNLGAGLTDSKFPG